MNKTLIIFIVLSIANKHLCAMEIGSTEKERLTDKQIIQAYGYLNDEELHHTLFDIDPTHNPVVYDGLARLIALRLADQHQLRHFAGTAGLNPRFTEHQKLVGALATITHDRMLKFKQRHTTYGETSSHRIYCCPASFYRFSRDGQHLAFLARNGKTITLWQLADGTQTHRLNRKTRLEDFGFSADGRYLITKKNQTTIELIPLTPTEKAITICGGNGVQFSTNGTYVAAHDEHSVQLTDVSTGALSIFDHCDTAVDRQEPCSMIPDGRIDYISFSPKGRYLRIVPIGSRCHAECTVLDANNKTIISREQFEEKTWLSSCTGNVFEQYTLAQNMLILKALHVARSGWHLF